MFRLVLCSLLTYWLSFGLLAQDFPAETVVCRTGSFVLESPLNDGLTYNYQWERSFDGGGSWLPTGGNSPELTISNPNGGILYRLAYAEDLTCLADPVCRQITRDTRLLVAIPAFSQGLVLCAGDTVFVGGEPLTQAGSHETILSTPVGCDSIVSTFIELLPAYDDFFFVDLCPGETFRGQQYVADTVVSERFTAATGCDSILTFEIAVAFDESPVIQGTNRVCSGEAVELSVSGSYATYAWSTGATDNTTEVTAGGSYGLTLTDFAGCQLILRHEVAETEVVIDNVETSDPSCPDAATGTLAIRASGSDDLLYSLDGGSSFILEPEFSGLPAGNYDLVVESAEGCRAERSVSLSPAPELNLNSALPERLTIERGDSVVLAVTPDFPAIEYRWSVRNFLSCTDCAAPVVYPTSSMSYTVEAVAQGGCSVSRSFQIEVLDNRRMYVPTAFSPNGDERNDRWRIFTGPRAEAIIGLQIADRWGGIRYTQTEAELPPDEAGWDGLDASGRELGAGVYLYTATVRFTDGSSKIIGGEITLMR